MVYGKEGRNEGRDGWWDGGESWRKSVTDETGKRRENVTVTYCLSHIKGSLCIIFQSSTRAHLFTILH